MQHISLLTVSLRAYKEVAWIDVTLNDLRVMGEFVLHMYLCLLSSVLLSWPESFVIHKDVYIVIT